MKVLGIHWGMCSTAALTIDGQVVAAASEERFSRMKNDDRFPARAIEYCMQAGKLLASDLSGVALATRKMSYDEAIVHKYCGFSIEDYLREQHEFWGPRLIEKREADYLTVFSDKCDRAQYPVNYWLPGTQRPADFDRDRERIVATYLEVPEKLIRRIDHHRAHSAYAYGASPFAGGEALVLTMDAHGDGLNATASIASENGAIRRVWETNACELARIYRYITLLLGMKPNEHEYKVMGLAPYAKDSVAERAYRVFADTLYVDGVEFKWKDRPSDLYFWFRDRLEGCRFDGIAGGLHRWVEELLTQWVRNAVCEFGVSTVAMSGGVAMNAKAMGRIATLPEVAAFFVPGTGSDESLALGAALCLGEDLGAIAISKRRRGVHGLLLGPEPGCEQQKEIVGAAARSTAYRVVQNPTVETIAEVLDNRDGAGKVIARCAGRMEFGARALGNRSILADPCDAAIVAKINRAIKNRDFWMPFAPVVLDGYADRYLRNPNRVASPHMTIIYETTDEGRQAMPAACHPADGSARAQIITRQEYPDLYSIVEAFARRTGRGALLNTSFNLHGSPIVNTPIDAWDTFNRSSLDGLILPDALILKSDAIA